VIKYLVSIEWRTAGALGTFDVQREVIHAMSEKDAIGIAFARAHSDLLETRNIHAFEMREENDN